MKEQFERTALLIQEDGVNRLADAHVAVFGIGGVGGFVVEALARAGVGALDLIDHDTVSVTNINRQIFATYETVGKLKVDVARERVRLINPDAVVTTYPLFFLPENSDEFPFETYDYIVDAIDTVTGKVELAVKAKAYHVPIISAMGAGNKMDPTAFVVEDLAKTSVCPLARVMRRELKKKHMEHMKVVYSKEKALTPYVINKEGKGTDFLPDGNEKTPKRSVPGSISFVPPVVGMIMAGEVIKDLILWNKETND